MRCVCMWMRAFRAFFSPAAALAVPGFHVCFPRGLRVRLTVVADSAEPRELSEDLGGPVTSDCIAFTTEKSPSCLSRWSGRACQGARKGTETKVTERAQNADFRRKTADFLNRTFSQKTEDFGRNHRRPQIGLRHLRSPHLVEWRNLSTSFLKSASCQGTVSEAMRPT